MNFVILVYLHIYVFDTFVQGIVVVFVVCVGCGAYLSDSTIPFFVPLFSKHTYAGRLAGIVCLPVVFDVDLVLLVRLCFLWCTQFYFSFWIASRYSSHIQLSKFDLCTIYAKIAEKFIRIK